MNGFHRYFVILMVCLSVLMLPSAVAAQTGNSSAISGTVVDPSGGLIPDAIVTIHDPVSGYERSATTNASGNFSFPNVPFNPYHMTVTAKGFASYTQDVEVRSAVPLDLKISLALAGTVSTVTVEAAGDLLETDSTAHTDIDRQLFNELPLESASSSVSSLVTLASPGVAADSNGLFHGLGDHAENSFSVDGQPVTDQQSKVFSNQIPVNAIQSLEVIDGAPPAEYGDKTSLVINVTTRSGQGVTTPHGSVIASYGTFGTSNTGFDLAYGRGKWGNFMTASGLNSGRFLDPPEFTVMHSKGNEENLFDRVDYQLSKADSVQLNLGYTRSWFQTPNSFDQQLHPGIVNNVTGNPLGSADQRSKIGTFNIAPTWTHLINSHTVFSFGGYVRKDQYNYYPSANPLNDLAPDLQAETATQNRKLTNAGARSDLSYVKGIHNLKLGANYEHTFLTEDDGFGIVDPTFNAPCLNADDLTPNTNPGVTNQTQCGSGFANTGQSPGVLAFNVLLGCYDLTRPVPDPTEVAAAAAAGVPCNPAASTLLPFHGHTDVKELALYGEDTITMGRWSFNVGLRGDFYNGIAHAKQAEPRLGIAYNIKPSSTVLRISYARTLETPFNENLVIASTGCSNPVLAAIVPPPGVPCSAGPITPGWRNEFHAGLQQAFGKYLVVDGEYIWKYTHNGFDFGIVGATPITFPIEWQRNKIPGYTVRASVPNFHGFSGFVVMSGVSARFFLPQVAGLPIIGPGTSVFRIDHDEKFNETTHFQYQPWKKLPWVSFNWRYDSGLVSGAVPCSAPTGTCSFSTPFADGGTYKNIPGTNTPLVSGQVLLANAITGGLLTADQEFQAGLTCNGTLAAPSPTGPALAVCNATGLGSTYLRVPAPGAENDDHNPQRISPRSLFDLGAGDDNLFHGDRYKWSLQVTAINVMNKVTLYNFLSTFSGTHCVTPRTVTGEIGFHF